MSLDHPIFSKSISIIRQRLGCTGLNSLEQSVLERVIHSGGDLSLATDLRFSSLACEKGISALLNGCIVLTDTTMAAVAVAPMAKRTLSNNVKCVLDWAPNSLPLSNTRSAYGMEKAWNELGNNIPAPIVLIGSAPTALEVLLNSIADGAKPPSLLIGMPVGFVGVMESKKKLAQSGVPQIVLEGNRGGAGLVAAALNALLRAAVI